MLDKNLVDQTDDLRRAIGDAVIRFQQVELWVAETLASMLMMKDVEDRYLVLAAMSFRQKVDLMVELFPRRPSTNLQSIDIDLVKKALNAAEEYRNRVVHSLWAIGGNEKSRWLRMKSSLRGGKGFSMSSAVVNVALLEECNKALQVIRDWEFNKADLLLAASDVLKRSQF